MRVVDGRKWKRAKIQFTFLIAAAILVSIGGLEGTDPMPAPEIAVMLFPVLYYMIWNLTKEYN